MIFVNSIEKLKQSLNDNVEITVESGVYDFSEPIEIKGLKNVKILCKDGAVMRGCVEIFPQFEDWQKGIKRAKLDYKCISALIVNGERLSLARFPDYDANAVLNGACSINQAPLSEWANINGGQIRALHEHDWGGNSYKILGKKEGKTGWNSLITEWVGDNNRGGKPNLNKLVFENFPDLIKKKGDWCYTDGYLYYYPKGNEKQYYAVVNHCIFDIANSSKITISGGLIEDTATTVFSFPYETPLRGDWGLQRLGAIKISDSKEVTVTGLKIRRTGTNAIFVDGNSSDCHIESCAFTELGASGIIFAGRESSCRDFSTWKNHKENITDTTAGPANDEFIKNCTVRNCYFYNLGLYEKQSAAVSASIAQNIVISHCTAHRLPRAAINISDGTFGGHKIEYNELFDCVRETSDHGPFNSWGRDRFWSLKKFNTTGKYGKIKKKYALLDAVKPTEIVNNRLYATKGFGIDLDDGSSNYIIRDNVCIGVGIKIREGFYRKVFGNALFHSALDVHCAFYKCDDIAENNAFISSKTCLNPVIMNKGNNFLMKNNFYINSISPRKYEKAPIYLDCDSIDYFDYSWLKEATCGKVNICSDIGSKIKCARPVIEYQDINVSSERIRVKGIILATVDASLQSACGLPEIAGAYIVGFSFFTFKKGLKERDVILSVNGKKINKAEDLRGEIKGEISVMRNQLPITIYIK